MEEMSGMALWALFCVLVLDKCPYTTYTLNIKQFEDLNKGEYKMLERVKEIIEEQLNLEGVEITESSSFKEDLGADSLDLFELVMAFEEEYGIEIPTEDLEKITTVGNIIEYMKSKGVEA